MNKSLLLTIMMFCVAHNGFTQNIFEKFYESEDGAFREGHHVVETADQGYIVSCKSQHMYQNDILMSISPEGDCRGMLALQIDNKVMKYSALFKHPDYTDKYLAIAVLSHGDNNAGYIQNSLAFLCVDNNLEIVSQRTYDFGDEYVRLIPESDYPRFLLDDGVLVMAANSLKKEGKCYVFAKFTTEGALIKKKDDSAMTSNADMLFDFFIKDKTSKSYGIIKYYTPGNGGDNYYVLDSSFNCTRVKRLTGMKVLDSKKPYYYHKLDGSGEYYNDTSFLITTGGTYVNGTNTGDFHFISLVNDSVDICKTVVWDEHLNNSNETSKWSAETKALSVTDDAIYHCGVTGIRDHSHYSGGSISPSTVVISKFDREFTLIWRRYVSHNNDYIDINTIMSTDDEGCLLTGICSKNPEYNNFLVYLLKLDANGYDNVYVNKDVVRPFFCYPNPASDYIRVELSPDANCELIEIHSVDGRIVETRHGMSLQTPIDISNLNLGVYMLKLRMSDGSEFFERIVKQ